MPTAKQLRDMFPHMSEETLRMNAEAREDNPPREKRTRRDGFDAMREKSALAADLSVPELEERPDRLIVRLNGERPFSWNLYTTSVNPMERRNEFRRVKDLVQMILFNAGYSRRPFSKRVGIEFRAYMLKPVYDPDNPAAKPYIDALQSFVIVKDDLRYVRAVLPLVIPVDSAPRVELHVGPDLPWLDYVSSVQS